MAQNLLLRICSGRIRGAFINSDIKPSFKYLAFKGIPYANPPSHSSRFQIPQPVTPWKGVLETRSFGSICPQIDERSGVALGSENCLTLNVFSKSIDKKKPKPVMVWFHGGDYVRGTGAVFGPEYLIQHDVVLVTLNFRLNVFGFFTSNDETAYGNMALKDQLFALQWIQKNILEFGGNPNKVTIFGQGSGAHSVSTLQLTPRSQGLFHRVIAQSGSCLNSRYLQRNPLKFSNELTYVMPTYSIENLQEIQFKKILVAADNIMHSHPPMDPGPFCPIIEVKNGDSILDEDPYKILISGRFNKVPYMCGYNSNEGSQGLKILGRSCMNLRDFDSKYEILTPHSLNLTTLEAKRTVGKIIRDFYFRGSTVCGELANFSRFLGDHFTVREMQEELDVKRQFHPVYFYNFTYKGTNTTPSKGVDHGEELQYLFNLKHQPLVISTRDIITMKRLTKLWTNFAKFGTPTPEDDVLLQNIRWQACDGAQFNTLDIGEELKMRAMPNEKEYIFWNELSASYGNQSYMNI